MLDVFDLNRVRSQFPGLRREAGGRQAVLFDGPGGSQVPVRVMGAVGRYLAGSNANTGGVFDTSVESDAILHEARRAVADLLGARDPSLVVFGANMTTLTFSLARALSRTWGSGDEVLVTRLDHDANVSPWLQAARDAGATARHATIRAGDCTLDLDDLQSKLTPQTRLVAIGAASNAVGTLNPVGRIVSMAHAMGAQVFLDAVHHAPHALMDVEAWGCDYLACSAYKFFGPHVGILYGRREALEALPVARLRPAPDALPHRWETGTQCHEGIAGTAEAVEYLAELGRDARGKPEDRRAALRFAFERIQAYEGVLSTRMLRMLSGLGKVRLYGIADPERVAERTPTFSFTHASLPPRRVAEHLAARGIFVWSGNFYAVSLTEALELEPDGLVRAGLLHYNTPDEVDRLGEALGELE